MSNVAVAERAQPRYEIEESFSVELVIEPDDHRAEPIRLAATVLNLSTRGAKLAVPMALERDRTVRIQLVVDRLGLSFYLSARVCWAAPAGTEASVVGCQLSPPIPDGILKHIAQGGRLNRRDQDRRPVEATVAISRQGARLWSREQGLLRNYAAGGVCLETGKSAALGEKFQIRLNGTQLGIVVRWVIQQDDRYLLGCEYEDAASYSSLEAALA